MEMKMMLKCTTITINHVTVIVNKNTGYILFVFKSVSHKYLTK